MSVRVSGLTYQTSNGATLVNKVDMDINHGELTCTLGPNGAGKTTLLRLLSGELRPTEGRIELLNTPLAHYSPDQRAKILGILPQSSALAFPYPVLDVVLLGRTPHHRSSSARADRDIAWDCLSVVEADHLGDRPYSTLSGGEKQRVQFARVLAQLHGMDGSAEGKVLLLDEPTSALDLAHQHQVLRIAKAFAERGAAVMAILHDLNLAAQYADRLVMMCKSRVVASGTVEEVLKPGMIHETYGVEAHVQMHPVLKCPLVSTC